MFLIIDDHTIVAEGVRNILARQFDDEIKIVNSLAEGGECLSDNEPRLMLLDIGMPDGNALDKLPEWRIQYPEMKVVILTCYAEAAVIARAKDAGANGYVLKDSGSDELVDVIKRCLSSDNAAFNMCKLAGNVMSNNIDEHAVILTPREREVLALIVNGLPVKQVADKLGLGFETVHSYTKILRAKLQVNNTAAMVRKAIEQKLI